MMTYMKGVNIWLTRRWQSVTYHLFLCPKKALGKPVMMSNAPSTPKPGSTLVSSTGPLSTVVELVLSVLFEPLRVELVELVCAVCVALGARVDIMAVGTKVVNETVLPLETEELVTATDVSIVVTFGVVALLV